jgi:hypothetical protein
MLQAPNREGGVVHKAVIGLVLIFCCSAALASDWRVLGRGDSGTKLVVDLQSISDADGRRSGWFKFVDPTDGSYDENLELANCSASTLKTKSFVSYDPRGKVLKSYTEHNDFILAEGEPTVPDTFSEKMLNFLCTYPIGADPAMIQMERDHAPKAYYKPRRS